MVQHFENFPNQGQDVFFARNPALNPHIAAKDLLFTSSDSDL